MFWDKKIFKANDIRGKYPEEINENVVFKTACGVKNLFKKIVVVGYDARLSSPALYNAVLAGLRFRKDPDFIEDFPIKSRILDKVGTRQSRSKNAKSGEYKLKIIEAGMITTPMLYFLVNKLNVGGGIMITASHNPKEYNGLKIVGKKAMPISGKEIYKIIFNS